MLKRFLMSLPNRIWLSPAIICLLSFALAIMFGILDSGEYIKPAQILPEIFLTSVELARIILGVIAGAMITMTIFTFSTTMVVLTTYSSQFSPRVVKNFLTNESTMKTQGVFMGGFIFAITTLAYMRNSIGNQSVSSAIFGIIYIIVCLIYFIKYITSVSSFIQMSNLIKRLYEEAIVSINEYRDFLKQGAIKTIPLHETRTNKKIVSSRENGYIQIIDYSNIIKLSKEYNVFLTLKRITGVFVAEGEELLTVDYEGDIEDGITEKLLNSITIGSEQNEFQDYIFSIHKISEVAIRAISPGINDPNTACHCIKIIGILIGKVADEKEGYLIVEDEETGMPIVAFETIEFSKLIYYTYYQIVNYGKSDVSVMIAVFRSFSFIARKASFENSKHLAEFMEYVWDKTDMLLKNGYDLEMLEAEKENASKLINDKKVDEI